MGVDINVRFKGLGGSAGTGGTSGGSSGSKSKSNIAGQLGSGIGNSMARAMGLSIGVAGGIGLVGLIRGISSKLIEVSGVLKGTFKLFETSMNLILRPIGDMFGNLLRPLAMWLLPMAQGFTLWMYSGGLQLLSGTLKMLTGLALIISTSITGVTGKILSKIGSINGAKGIEFMGDIFSSQLDMGLEIFSSGMDDWGKAWDIISANSEIQADKEKEITNKTIENEDKIIKKGERVVSDLEIVGGGMLNLFSNLYDKAMNLLNGEKDGEEREKESSILRDKINNNNGFMTIVNGNKSTYSEYKPKEPQWSIDYKKDKNTENTNTKNFMDLINGGENKSESKYPSYF